MSWKGEVEIGIGSGGIGSWNLTLALVQWKWCRLGRRGEERRVEDREERFVFRACLRTDRSLFCFEDNCEDHTRHETEIENEQTTGQEVKNT